MAPYYSDSRSDCKKNFCKNFIFFLTNKNIELYLQTNKMIQSNHDFIAVRLDDREGGISDVEEETLTEMDGQEIPQ